MSAKKVYESIIKLLYNVIRDDELKYHLLKEKNYLDSFVNLVNDLLQLEVDEKADYKDLQWARTFGKAIVLLVQKNQRIQKSNKSVDEIYEDYSKFISTTNKEFKKKNLDNTTINFTQQDVLDDAKLSDAKVARFDELEQEKQAAIEKETATKNQAEQEKPSNDDAAATSAGAAAGATNQQNTGFNPFFGNLPGTIPMHPAADPRFYPYNKKQKWFPIVKIILGVMVAIFSALMLILPIFGMVQTIAFPKDTELINGWQLGEAMRNANPGKTLIGDLDWAPSLTGQQSLLNIFSLIILLVFGAIVAYLYLRKPRSLKEKYRVSYFTIAPIILVFVSNIAVFWSFLSPTLLQTVWQNTILNLTGESKFTPEQLTTFNKWWAEIVVSKNLVALQGLSLAGLIFGVITIVAITGVMIAQPHLDRNKIAYADAEYQKAFAAAMQGKEYKIDESLFESDDETIITKKSKFKIWVDKTFKKKKKDK